MGDRKINDDFGLNYLPGLPNTGINRSVLEIDDKNAKHNYTMLNDSRDAPAYDDDFEMGMGQFTSFRKEQLDTARAKSVGNFL
jgi:hypothetical protein